MTDDLIGRAEAQTAIQFAAKRYTVAHEAHGEGQVVWSDNLINVIDAMNVLRDLPSVQPEQRWIPVEERFPEPWDLVLVTDRCKDVRVCQMHHNSSDGWYDECDNWMYFNTSVIAWMPLPEPYQEGEQE